ncbi:hypothetical protein [Actinophytocola xanthii]|uniref:hypothetical protein n=1 Tax=Actinophytocola xanthii TaxID=1912961 RepID=UPI0038BDC5DC
MLILTAIVVGVVTLAAGLALAVRNLRGLRHGRGGPGAGVRRHVVDAQVLRSMRQRQPQGRLALCRPGGLLVLLA